MSLATGVHLGPYEVLAPLGAGGMGEVYRALDPRLGREVAVKVLPEPVAKDPDRLRRFEHEARAVGALNHPNILTVHDVGSHEGSPYVVTELLEGENLREVLLHRAPTARQVLGWAVQAAHGLAAAHQKGIVHRDVKPENLFLTTDGRLKILDFGLAKLVSQPATDTEAGTASAPSEAGVVLGTVAYMSPEQVSAEVLDHRTDLFSLGIVLYELLCREHPFRRATVPATLTAILHEAPLELSARHPGLPAGVERIVRRCLEKRREDRYQSAHDLAVALEDLLERGSSASALREVEERSPYPGLSSFTEEDAGRFFGREDEVAALWAKLRGRRLLAVIGPSGAGKSSFVRAGVVASRPEGWAAIVATPGAAPLRGLGQALAPQLAHDPEALRKLLTFDDPEVAFELLSRWRRGHDEALVIVDQFEELFTLNAPEAQSRFATLLGRLAGEADVHVLLSLRDDFLMRCHEQEALAPVFDALTPLGPMTRDGLRRALVEPAAKRGYRFEDEALVEEMVWAVEGARGALPLLAFAVSRLWEKRRPEEKLLTREAYAEIGGVAGALARHAEETLERIGAGLEGTVRELFRNLTTAQGTRATLEREELLSAVPDRAAAETALAKLIDARLLTSWETEAAEGQPARHRIEIVHESLLSAWPRLVRWQTQDADGAQLRDQLRQAAHLWEERKRPEDLLWTGTSYLDYRVWRARYPGKLSSLEEDFSRSMTDRAERARRRRRTAVASAGAALLAVAAVLAVLWSRSETQRVRAEASNRKAEASKLLALAQLEADADPTAALAYVTKSLDLDDTETARLFALRVTQNAPVASELARSDDPPPEPFFSPDGKWLAVLQDRKVLLFHEDGRPPVTMSPGDLPPGRFKGMNFGPDGRTIRIGFRDELRVLSVPDGREVGRVKYENAVDGWNSRWDIATKKDGSHRTLFRRPWDGSGEWRLGTWDRAGRFSPDGRTMSLIVDRRLSLASLSDPAAPPRLLGEHPVKISGTWFSPDGRRLAAVDQSGEIRIWDPDSRSGRPVRVFPAPRVRGSSGINAGFYSAGGGWLLGDTGGGGHATVQAWDLAAPPGAEPLVFRSKAGVFYGGAQEPFDRAHALRDGQTGKLFLWHFPGPRPHVFEWREGQLAAVGFTPDGATLIGRTTLGRLCVWPLSPNAAPAIRELNAEGPYGGILFQSPSLAVAPGSRTIVAGYARGTVRVMPVDGGEPRELRGLPDEAVLAAVAISPDGRKVAAAPAKCAAATKRIHVWDLVSGATEVLEPVPKADDDWAGSFRMLAFAGNERIVATVEGEGNGLMLFDLRDGKGKVLSPGVDSQVATGRSGRFGVALACRGEGPGCNLVRFGFDGSPPVPLPYRAAGGGLALDPTETLLASVGPEGSVQVAPLDGGEPHLLFGHRGAVRALAFSPDGKWLASGGDDQTVRLWPVPDVRRVPPHRRSREEFLATLRTFTNVRAVPDPKAPNGWRLEAGPFPGWRKSPHW